MTSSARARPIRRARCCTPPAPGFTPVAASGCAKTADSRAAKRMSHASTNSLPAPRAPLNLRDTDEPARAQTAEKKADRRFTDELRRLLPVLFDPGHVDMGDEIVGVGTLEDEYLDGVVGLSLLNERDQIADQFRP